MTPNTTDCPIVVFYDLLLRLEPSPIVESLNRAVAVAMAQGPVAGLAIIERLVAGGSLAETHLLHATRADLLRRAGRTEESRDAYLVAIALSRQEAERRFRWRRLMSLDSFLHLSPKER